MNRDPATALSVVLPIYNEEQGIPLLFTKLREALAGREYEIIAVNDGSRDASWEALIREAAADPRIRLLNFRRNFGQTAAITAGIQNARGAVIVLLDSDLENDPADIPLLLAKLDEGYDVVSGWRKNRWEGRFFTRKLPSRMANWLISRISGTPLHDYGCTLKAYRYDVIHDVRLYGQMHRFIPVYCKWQGGRVAELPVSYRQRPFGKSNYGLFRIYRVLLDLVLIRFLDKYMQRPMHFFGGTGIISFLGMLLAAGLAVYFKVTGQKDFVQTPLPIMASVFLIVGVLMVLMGVLAEIVMRTYYESQGRFPFTIRDRVNFDS